jgi:hypothetical protein
MSKERKKPTSYALSDDAKKLLSLVSAKHGISLSSTLELVIREAAEKRGIALPAGE